MVSVGLILLCILAINNKCIASGEEEGEETPLFSTNTDLHDPSVFLSNLSPFIDPEALEGTALQTDQYLTEQTSTFGFLNDDNIENGDAALSIFANSNENEAGCAFGTGQLTDSNTLSRRGAVNAACGNPDAGSGGGSSSSSSILNTPASIDPKVAPFIDLGTMELKRICPRTDQIPYSLPVCSSGVQGDIVMHPPKTSFELNWAQKST